MLQVTLLPPDMQYTDKLLIVNTTACKDLNISSFTEDFFNNKKDGKVVDETVSERFSPTPLLLDSSTGNQNYQEEVKVSSEPQLANYTTAEVSSLIN